MTPATCSYWEGCLAPATHLYGGSAYCAEHDVRTPEEATIGHLLAENERLRGEAELGLEARRTFSGFRAEITEVRGLLNAIHDRVHSASCSVLRREVQTILAEYVECDACTDGAEVAGT